jgi:peroxiredoxin
MARTESQQSELGSAAPDFDLPDTTTSGDNATLDEVAKGSKALLVLFICNHCPFVIAIIDGLVEVAKEYRDAGLATVAISSNSVKTHPQDGPDKMAEFAAERGFGFPYLYDETQDVAKAYGAVCTPDIYLYDSDRKLRYRGQFDDSRPSNGKPVTGADLRSAVQAVLAGKPVDQQKPSIGCSIKWHPDTSGGREDDSLVPE